MKITWYGHAAFLIETGVTRIILDPYRSPDAGGYKPINETADLVVVSHENDRYHSHLGQIVPPFQLIKALEIPDGGIVTAGLRFQSIHVFEDAHKRPDDEVTIIHFEAEGLHIVFLGDLGHALNEEELHELHGADIVLAATGGPPTIDLTELKVLLEAIEPEVVVPMHYKVEGKINLKIEPVESFIKAMSGWPIRRVEGSILEIGRDRMPLEPEIVWLHPAR